MHELRSYESPITVRQERLTRQQTETTMNPPGEAVRGRPSTAAHFDWYDWAAVKGGRGGGGQIWRLIRCRSVITGPRRSGWMRTGPCDVLLLALARPTVNIDTDDIVARRQSRSRADGSQKFYVYLLSVFFFLLSPCVCCNSCCYMK